MPSSSNSHRGAAEGGVAQPQVCIYCGSSDLRLTRDHIPPKCLFLRPRPQLITVPACHPCNDSFKRDDEYFRLAVISEAVYRNEEATRLWRGRVMPRIGGGLRGNLIARMRNVEMRTPAGVITGRATAIHFDVPRVNRVVKRIVKGLTWHHYQFRPTNVRFEIYFNPDLRPLHDILLRTSLHTIGNAAFRYRHGLTKEDRNASVWGLRFYEHTHFLVLVLSDSYLERDAT